MLFQRRDMTLIICLPAIHGSLAQRGSVKNMSFQIIIQHLVKTMQPIVMPSQ